MITASNLSARGVFSDIDLDVATGDLLVIEGPHRSGKTALLLALAGRFSTRGHLATPSGRRFAFAEQPTVNPLDEALTVEQHVAQAVVLAGPWWQAIARRSTVRSAAGHFPIQLRLNAKIGELSPFERFACGVGLALVQKPAVLCVDDVDSLRESTDRAAAWRLLQQLDPALTIVATCQDAAELSPSDERPVIHHSLKA